MRAACLPDCSSGCCRPNTNLVSQAGANACGGDFGILKHRRDVSYSASMPTAFQGARNLSDDHAQKPDDRVAERAIDGDDAATEECRRLITVAERQK